MCDAGIVLINGELRSSKLCCHEKNSQRSYENEIENKNKVKMRKEVHVRLRGPLFCVHGLYSVNVLSVSVGCSFITSTSLLLSRMPADRECSGVLVLVLETRGRRWDCV